MGRPGLTRHRKFLRLAQELQSRALARGILELLWDSGYEAGEPVVGDATDVEVVCDWRGKRGALARALLQAGGSSGPGFLERDGSGRLVIHDFWDHAPEYVARRAQREAARVARGLTISEIRSKAGRAGAQAKRARREGGVVGRQNASDRNYEESLATDKQVASTPAPLKAIAFASARGPSASGFDEGRAAVVKEQNPNLFSTTTTPLSCALEERETLFLSYWNSCRVRRGRDTEPVTPSMLPRLVAMLDAAHQHNEERALTALSLMVSAFLDDETFKTRSLSNLLKKNVWVHRLDEAFARAKLDEERNSFRL